MAKDSLLKASTPEPFSRSKTSNWVARGGGLPDYVQHVAQALVKDRGVPESQAIEIAIGVIKNWAAGKGKVDANTRAAAAKALKEWDELKAKNAATSKVKEASMSVLDREWPDDLGVAELGEHLVVETVDEKAQKMPSVYCVKDQARVTPTDAGKCPKCGMDLSKAIRMAKKNVSEASISMTDRRKLPSSAFAIPEKAPNVGSYPIHDQAHAANALSQAAGKPEEARVKAAVYKKWPAMKPGAKSS